MVSPHEQCVAQIAIRLLPIAVPRLGLEDVFDEVSLFALLAVAAGTSHAPALSRAVFSCTRNDWLRGDPDSGADDGDDDVEEGAVWEELPYRFRFNTWVARVATRLLELAPRAVPEIVLTPRTMDIARVIVATQPECGASCCAVFTRRSIPGNLETSGVWRRGLRQLLRQLHELYIVRLSEPLCHALNTLQAPAAVDA
jgi:hypothetical protein